MSSNIGEVLLAGIAVGSDLPIPLLPLQILFLNLATDVFPAFARRLQRSIRSWLINGCMDGFGIWRMAA